MSLLDLPECRSSESVKELERRGYTVHASHWAWLGSDAESWHVVDIGSPPRALAHVCQYGTVTIYPGDASRIPEWAAMLRGCLFEVN